MVRALTEKQQKDALKSARAGVANYIVQLKTIADKIKKIFKASSAASFASFKYYDTPSGTKYDDKRGCATAHGCIRPHPDWKNLNVKSAPDPACPSGLPDVKLIFPNEGFISGHMINEAFGGNGKVPTNQVILTDTANGQHRFDEDLKSAAADMGMAVHYMSLHSQDTENLDDNLKNICGSWGIEIDVVVDADTWWSRKFHDAGTFSGNATWQTINSNLDQGYPVNCVPVKITSTAKEVNRPTDDYLKNTLMLGEDDYATVVQYFKRLDTWLQPLSSFELIQNPPDDFDKQALVDHAITDKAGTKTADQSIPKPRKKPGQAKVLPPVPATYQLVDASNPGTVAYSFVAGGWGSHDIGSAVATIMGVDPAATNIDAKHVSIKITQNRKTADVEAHSGETSIEGHNASGPGYQLKDGWLLEMGAIDTSTNERPLRLVFKMK